MQIFNVLCTCGWSEDISLEVLMTGQFIRCRNCSVEFSMNANGEITQKGQPIQMQQQAPTAKKSKNKRNSMTNIKVGTVKSAPRRRTRHRTEKSSSLPTIAIACLTTALVTTLIIQYLPKNDPVSAQIAPPPTAPQQVQFTSSQNRQARVQPAVVKPALYNEIQDEKAEVHTENTEKREVENYTIPFAGKVTDIKDEVREIDQNEAYTEVFGFHPCR